MISTILLVAVSISFIAYAYFYPPKNFLSTKNRDTICMNYANETISKLKVNLIHHMTNGYKQNQLKHIKAVMKDDAHSICFDLETLKKFIYHVEINAKKNEVSGKDLGLRMYYSRYPKIESWHNQFTDLSDFTNNSTTRKYEDRHTLIMIPTINKKGVQYDFNPTDIRTYGEKMELFAEYQSGNTATSIPALTITKSSGSSSNTSGQNHGSLIPPINTTGESF